MFAALQLGTHALLGFFEALHTLLHLKVSTQNLCNRMNIIEDNGSCLLGGSHLLQVLLSLPPRYSIADLKARFWYFISDAATVPASVAVLSLGMHSSSLKTLLLTSVAGVLV
jgi:hypothetical protein